VITPEEARRRFDWDLCHRCADPLPPHDNFTMAFCGSACRQAAYRARLNYRRAHPSADDETLTLAGSLTVPE
jgi:hypothetical protein